MLFYVSYMYIVLHGCVWDLGYRCVGDGLHETDEYVIYAYILHRQQWLAHEFAYQQIPNS